jgi:hypothetical protein
MKTNITTWLTRVMIIALVVLISIPEESDARGGFGGGRSFGGGGRSFGGSRKSFSTPKSSPRPSSPKSFGGSRPSAPAKSFATPQSRMSSFGGQRMSSPTQYTSKYGTPRKTETRSFAGANGVQQNYQINSYGGYGSGLMMGYMMGHSSMMWSMPFHPAFYYSRPHYVTNPDGTIGVYPPTFSFAKLIFGILIFAVIIYIIYAIFRSKKRKSLSQSSFS